MIVDAVDDSRFLLSTFLIFKPFKGLKIALVNFKLIPRIISHENALLLFPLDYNL